MLSGADNCTLLLMQKEISVVALQDPDTAVLRLDVSLFLVDGHGYVFSLAVV